MNFVELTEKEFDSFFKKHPLSTFLQSPHFNAADELENWKIVYLGVKKGKKVIAGARVKYTPTHFNKYIYYYP